MNMIKENTVSRREFTETPAMNSELRSTERVKNQARIAATEIRNNLLSLADTDERKYYRLLRLADHAEAIALSDSHIAEIKLSSFCLTKLVYDITAMLCGMCVILKTGIALALPNELLIAADKSSVSKMLLNMIGTAIIYGAEQTAISIRELRGNAIICLAYPKQNTGEPDITYPEYLTAAAKRNGGIFAVTLGSDSVQQTLKLPLRDAGRYEVDPIDTLVADVLTEMSNLLPERIYRECKAQGEPLTPQDARIFL